MSELLDAIGQPHLQLVLRVMLGGVLLLAGVTKLADREAFPLAVAEYDVLPPGLVRPFAALLPFVELALGVLLLVGLATAAAGALAVPLFLAFAFAIGVNLLRGRSFDCHCFGAVQSDPIGFGSLLRSLGLAAVALVVAVGASAFGALDAAVFGASDLPAAGDIFPALLIAFVVFDVLILLPAAAGLQAAFADWQRTRITGGGHVHTHANGHEPQHAMVEVEEIA